MNSSDKAAIIFVGMVLLFILVAISILVYSDYLDSVFSQKAMEGGYEQVWDEEGMRVLWKKSNPSIP